MFTGLIESLGQVRSLTSDGEGGKRLHLECEWFSDTPLGASIAVNGACLTLVERTGSDGVFQVGPETLLRTNLGRLVANDRVNLERSLKVGDRLDGHFVQGHVDGLGEIISRQPSGPWDDVQFRCPATLTRLMVPKGSIAVDGISLTVVSVEEESFRIMLIPHTLAKTTLGFKKVGDVVNLEADMLAKHVAKLLGK